MAVVADGRARRATLHIPMPDRTITAKVFKSTVFYDPKTPHQRLTMEDRMNVCIPQVSLA